MRLPGFLRRGDGFPRNPDDWTAEDWIRAREAGERRHAEELLRKERTGGRCRPCRSAAHAAPDSLGSLRPAIDDPKGLILPTPVPAKRRGLKTDAPAALNAAGVEP